MISNKPAYESPISGIAIKHDRVSSLHIINLVSVTSR